ncbi:DNA helicase-2/ATP-dependent DNA helicase PcrA [Paenibacillus endophyticus]|uniref:DNA helicase-2/ATP-dependent DNA helicase PcrA n=1 Tax=Paenibacillus endophyticus TaxID=1294268 RepID=A0A7W5G8W5_9BACL|nr:RNA polymerase recycling motor HelD [Paenibacillus endophyticus]MBB3151090.1 DNA helicase-2/ATP-dependent DNA helicase PcrA [Paenibacillus endophyticus]
MTNINKERTIEQQRVDQVTEVIRARIEDFQAQVGGMRDDIVDIRRNFWDDVTLNFEDAAESAESHASMKQQAEVLSERERSHRHIEEQLKTLLKLEHSPYFGRIDLAEEGQEKADPIYLGVGSLLDDSGYEYLIYDWRAPVSSLYYDSGPGPVAYETPSGKIKGEMTLKRQFIIRDGQIRSMFDTGVTIGDELLQEVLGKQSDAQMKSIVATIQREQNQIIRNERARLLIVQGAAGSGKTSAALQRVAYLLYRYRGILQADQIVLFSPNPMFNSYVATVLPELGEQNMQQTTYQQYLEHRLGKTFALEDPFSQMEYTLAETNDPGYEARIDGITYKSGVSFMHLIDSYAAGLSEAGLSFKAITFKGRTLISEEAIKEQFYKLDRTVSIGNRMRLTAEWMLKELTRLSREEREQDWVHEEIELLDQEAYAKAFDELQRKNRFAGNSFDDFDAERDFLAAMVVQAKFKKLRKRVKRLLFLDVPVIYKRLFESDAATYKQALDGSHELPENWADISEQTLAKLNSGEVLYEDATPYLYLKEKLEGFHTNTLVKHLFIDEAQDYSPFQYHYLKRIFPNCKMTVLGDLNQSIFAHAVSGNGFDPLADLFSEEETEKIILARSYRSTRPIVAFTSKMIEGGDLIEPFNRDGEEPTITKVEDETQIASEVYSRVNKLVDTGYSSIAVICKTAAEGKRMHTALLAYLPSVRLIEKETVTFEKGIIVIPSYLAKGVEFDAVIIGNANQEHYGRESERKLFYTACTRAMHELHLLYTDELTTFIR